MEDPNQIDPLFVFQEIMLRDCGVFRLRIILYEIGWINLFLYFLLMLLQLLFSSSLEKSIINDLSEIWNYYWNFCTFTAADSVKLEWLRALWRILLILSSTTSFLEEPVVSDNFYFGNEQVYESDPSIFESLDSTQSAPEGPWHCITLAPRQWQYQLGWRISDHQRYPIN
jgi:hypothetical protein